MGTRGDTQVTSILTPEQFAWFETERKRLHMLRSQFMRKLVTEAMQKGKPLTPLISSPPCVECGGPEAYFHGKHSPNHYAGCSRLAYGCKGMPRGTPSEPLQSSPLGHNGSNPPEPTQNGT